jgi:hypothetical protein
MLKVYKIIIPLLLLTLVESCGGGGDGGYYNYYDTYYYYGIHLIDSGNLIKEIRFAPMSNSKLPIVLNPNSNVAPWKISSAFDITTMYITTKNKTDTLLIQSKNVFQYQSSAVNYQKAVPKVIKSTFDTVFVHHTDTFMGYYNEYITDTLYLKLK